MFEMNYFFCPKTYLYVYICVYDDDGRCYFSSNRVRLITAVDSNNTYSNFVKKKKKNTRFIRQITRHTSNTYINHATPFLFQKDFRERKCTFPRGVKGFSSATEKKIAIHNNIVPDPIRIACS